MSMSTFNNNSDRRIKSSHGLKSHNNYQDETINISMDEIVKEDINKVSLLNSTYNTAIKVNNLVVIDDKPTHLIPLHNFNNFNDSKLNIEEDELMSKIRQFLCFSIQNEKSRRK